MFLLLALASLFFIFFFFFKQKTAYEMRISDWSSDVCSSDLPFDRRVDGKARLNIGADREPHMVEEQFISLGPQRLVAAVMFGSDRTAIAKARLDRIGIGKAKDIFVERWHRRCRRFDRHRHTVQLGRGEGRERGCKDW